MDYKELDFTRYLERSTISYVSSSVDEITRRVNAFFEGERMSKKQKTASVDKATREALLELFAEIHDASALSVRRSLLQYLYTRGENVDPFLFELADEASSEELKPYIPLLLKYISDPDSIWETRLTELLVSGQWIHGNMTRDMTKEDAFVLGHALRFTAEEMDAFLVRTMEDDGFDFTNSRDIVHLFCFLTNRSQSDAEGILRQYKKFVRQNQPSKLSLKEKELGFTENLQIMLRNNAPQWMDGSDGKELFLAWLEEHAPVLDVPSQAAHDIYYRLAMLYIKVIDPHKSFDYGSISNAIIDLIDEKGQLEWSHAEAERMGHAILLSTADMAALEAAGGEEVLRDFEDKFDDKWFYLHRDPCGHIQKKHIGNHVISALLGDAPVSKADLLLLLLGIYEAVYQHCPLSNSLELSMDYMLFAKDILEKAHFTFYLPHMLEYSLVCCVLTNTDLNIFFDEAQEEEEKSAHPAPKKLDAEKVLRTRESHLVNAAGQQFRTKFANEKQRPMIEALANHFQNRANGSKVIFDLEDGAVYEYIKGKKRDRISVICALEEADALQFWHKALEIHKAVWDVPGEERSVVIAKKLYLSAIAHAISPVMVFRANAKSKLLLTKEK